LGERRDALNRLSQVKDAEGAVIAAYAYDAFNRRISSTDSSGITYFHYDGASPNVIAETNGDGGTIATYTYDAAGRLHSMSRGGETYYYHANGHGDVVALTDATGAVVDHYRYDPWGRVLSASESIPNPYRYAGYRYDQATGLYQLWNRYYSPSTFRFLTKDPYPGDTTSPATMNGYAYCLGNPTSHSDPTGLFVDGGVISIPVALIFTAAVAAALCMESPEAQRGMGETLEGISGQVQKAWNESVPAIGKGIQDCVNAAKSGSAKAREAEQIRRATRGMSETQREAFKQILHDMKRGQRNDENLDPSTLEDIRNEVLGK
jgi:RHS repeat-associated protein